MSYSIYLDTYRERHRHTLDEPDNGRVWLGSHWADVVGTAETLEQAETMAHLMDLEVYGS